jgi:alpha-glucosidase
MHASSPRRLVKLVCTLFAGSALAAALVPGAAAQVAGSGEMVTPKLAEGMTSGGGIARFYAPGVDGARLPPSLALRWPMDVKASGKVDGSFKVQPGFWTDADGKFCVKINIDAGTSLYGTGEIAGPLLRNGRKTIAWNTDAYGYTEANPSLYQSHPWVLAVRSDGSAFGVLADTTWRVGIDLSGAAVSESAEGQPGPGGSIVFRGEGSPYAVYVVDRASPQEVMKGLGELIGAMPMPPLWAIGYHQCRYSYFPEARVREIATGFRSRQIPCDVIWFDIDYMDNFKVFSFNREHFPDPKKLNDDLGKMGFSRIWMINPGVKEEKSFAISDQLRERNLGVTNAKGELYRGEVWPGWCNFPDYTRPEVRQWWQTLYKPFMAMGVNGVWNDMNEPAVFNVPSKTMPEDNIHLGGAWDYGGTLPQGPHLQYHNVYGMLMAKGTSDGILASNPDKRPFVLTRAGYIGSHRYAATWTGDNNATWDDVENSISMAGNLSLSGAPFIGPDIGGFNGNGPQGKDQAQTDQLRATHFARWMGIGSLLPFSRGHTGKGNIDKEPWSFGPATEQTCKLALERRYRLMPYLYTLFREASITNMPVLRPTFFADPADPALRSEDDSFLLGSDLLVVAQPSPERERVHAMPKGSVPWAQVMLVDEGNHPDLPRLFVRPGAIVPLGPVMQYTGEKPLDPIELLVALDDKGNATGTLYEDDGDGFGHLRGDYLLTTYTAKLVAANALKIDIASKEGNRARFQRQIRVRVLKDGKFWTAAGTDGQSITMNLERLPAREWEFAPPPVPGK